MLFMSRIKTAERSIAWLLNKLKSKDCYWQISDCSFLQEGFTFAVRFSPT
jgi:hypothetical protein